jgi:N-acyl-D-aspartate/D-glutamate deacylase
MRSTFRRAVRGMCATALLLPILSCSAAEEAAVQEFDTVLANGRVMDPESGLDAVRNVGIAGGRIGAISEGPLSGRTVVDVSGLVVAPGFIDLHAHGQTARDGRLQAQDGVTTALDMEGGVYPAGQWYASREGHSPVNFGAGAGHNAARIKLKHGIDIGHRSTDQTHPELRIDSQLWANEPATGEEIERLVGLVEQALNEGALGVSLATEYAPAASRIEVFRLFQLAAREGATVFVHVRASGMAEPGSGLGAIQEVVADAAVTGASLHIVHLTSSALRSTSAALEMIDAARARGIDISTEAYPYTAGSTLLASAYFGDGWQERLGIRS